MVSKMLIQNCLPMPTCRNTPRGGRSIAIMMRSRSIVYLFLLLALYLIRCPNLLVAGPKKYPAMLHVRIEPSAPNTNILGPLAANMIHNVFHA